MDQNPLTVMVPIRSEELRTLRGILAEIGNDVERNARVRFRESPSTHFARWVILEHDARRGPRLLFSSNHDGDLPGYAQELARTVGAGMEPIWSACRGYTSGTATDGGRLAEFFSRHWLPTQAFYVASPGAAVTEILESTRRREALNAQLDGPDAEKLLAELSLLVPGTPPRPPAPAPDPAAQGSLASRIVEWLAGIREGAPRAARRLTVEDELIQIEDRVVQNQMTVVSPVKAGLWPRLFVRLVLLLVAAQARGAHGSLSGITTIHFARWVLIDDGEYLLFESNYDGSWENYIDDFVDFASTGMNAIWGTAKDFPPAGCRDTEGFKAIIRKYQRPTQVFYSAYPNSTVENNLNDLELARALTQHRPDESVRRFLTGTYGAVS